MFQVLLSNYLWEGLSVMINFSSEILEEREREKKKKITQHIHSQHVGIFSSSTFKCTGCFVVIVAYRLVTASLLNQS